jgi:hypothetical protein
MRNASASGSPICPHPCGETGLNEAADQREESIISSCRTVESRRSNTDDTYEISKQINSEFGSNKSTENSDGVRRILYICRLSACPIIATPSLP